MRTGPNNCITDVDGVFIGNAHGIGNARRDAGQSGGSSRRRKRIRIGGPGPAAVKRRDKLRAGHRFTERRVKRIADIARRIDHAALAAGDTISEANVKIIEAGEEVSVSRIPDGIYLRSVNDPDDIIWERLPEYRVHLAPAPPVHPSVDLRIDENDAGQDVYVTLARTSERFYVRMRWRDETQDAATRLDRFRDGAAVQFAIGDEATSYIMGTGPEEPVNIWYWRSDSNTVESLAAGGPGSTTALEDQPVTGDARYVRGEKPIANQWVVVMVILNYIANHIIQSGNVNEKFVADHTNFRIGNPDIGYGLRPEHPLEQAAANNDKAGGSKEATFEDYAAFVSEYTLEKAHELSGVPKNRLQALAELYADPDTKVMMQVWPEVVTCERITGAVDYLIKVVAEDIKTYDDFLREKLLDLDLVSDVQSRIVVSTVKDSAALPIHEP